MSYETSGVVVAGHVFDRATDRCDKCGRHRFYCAGDVDYGCCIGKSTDYERGQLESIQDICWKVTQDIAEWRGGGPATDQVVDTQPAGGDGCEDPAP